jgi:hypothetical protein
MFPGTENLAYAWVRDRILPEDRILATTFVRLPAGGNYEGLDSVVLKQVELPSSLKALADYKAEGVEYLILDEWHVGMVLGASGRRRYDRQAREKYTQFLKELEQSATLAASFDPYREPGPKFDPENVYFATRHLEKMKRLGPFIWIYKL